MVLVDFFGFDAEVVSYLDRVRLEIGDGFFALKGDFGEYNSSLILDSSTLFKNLSPSPFFKNDLIFGVVKLSLLDVEPLEVDGSDNLEVEGFVPREVEGAVPREVEGVGTTELAGVEGTEIEALDNGALGNGSTANDALEVEGSERSNDARLCLTAVL